MTIIYKTKEEFRQEVDRLWDCYNAMMLPFMAFSASINKAVGATNVTDSYSPKIYLQRAQAELANIEKVISNYRNNELQDFQKEVE